MNCRTCGTLHPGRQPCERLLCGRCHGDGRVWPYTVEVDGALKVKDTCPRCLGSGAVYQNGHPAPANNPTTT